MLRLRGIRRFEFLALALAHPFLALAHWAAAPAERHSAWAPARSAALSLDVLVEAPALERWRRNFPQHARIDMHFGGGLSRTGRGFGDSNFLAKQQRQLLAREINIGLVGSCGGNSFDCNKIKVISRE